LYTPQRLFGEIGLSSDILSHEPFLERARLQREQERDGSARLALGAYVVARLVNKLLTMQADSDSLDGFRWQLDAVRRHLSDLPADAPETAHLGAITASVSADGGTNSGLWMNLTAYAYFLEHEGRLEESLEILSLATQVQGQDTPLHDFAAYALFAARLNRQLARWDNATNCYAAAEEAAIVCGDNISALRGRLGQGAVHRGRGNLPLARDIAESVVRDASKLSLPEVQALGYADLGAVYALQGLKLEELQANYQAFRLTPDAHQRMRTLGDLGSGLFRIGAYQAARLAFELVIQSNTSFVVRSNALLELMDLESTIGNRVSFERCRNMIEPNVARLSPSMATDYQFKLGTGFMRFGQPTRSKAALLAGLECAERHQLNAWYFRIEQALKELTDSPQQPEPSPVADLSEVPAIRQMEIGLREFALSPED
jgi:tetratricopeptide (TPR) repeat protein